jgi:hypothetical protein
VRLNRVFEVVGTRAMGMPFEHEECFVAARCVAGTGRDLST